MLFEFFFFVILWIELFFNDIIFYSMEVLVIHGLKLFSLGTLLLPHSFDSFYIRDLGHQSNSWLFIFKIWKTKIFLKAQN